MRSYHRWLVVFAMIIASLYLSSCEETPSSEETKGDKSAKVEDIPGSDLHHVILTKDAVKRLDLKTTAMQQTMVEGKQRKVIPYSAVLYDANGKAWVYTVFKPLTFVRAEIIIDSIDGDLAILSSGPPNGTEVVTVGVSELYGSEFLGIVGQ